VIPFNKSVQEIRQFFLRYTGVVLGVNRMRRKSRRHCCRYFLPFVLLTLFSQLADGQKRPEREADGFVGPVKTVYVTTAYLAEDEVGQPHEFPALSHSFTYDEKGHLLEDGEIFPDGSSDTKRTYKYDASGREVEHAYYVHDGLVFRTVKSYDKSGKETQSVEYGNRDSIQSIARSSYKLSGRLQKILVYEPKDTLRRKLLIVFDRKRLMIERREYDANGGQSGRYVFSYDASGNKTEEIHYYKDSSHRRCISREAFAYDSKDRLIEESWYDNGSLRTKEVSKRDENGNLIEGIRYDGNGSIEERSTISYLEFDSHGNWVKANLKTKAKDKVSPANRTTIIRRTITYFAAASIAESQQG
jgi:antitoxin component YwqK of YwqJK toxin-antitoxin module